MSLDAELIAQFNSLCSNQTFRDLLVGIPAPPCIDYWFRPLETNQHIVIPSNYVEGRTIVPLFYGCDSYAFYCLEPSTSQFHEIDPESPWPPVFTADRWQDFEDHYFARITEDKEPEFVQQVSLAFGRSPRRDGA